MSDIVKSAQRSISDATDSVSSKLSSTMQGLKGLGGFAFGRDVLNKVSGVTPAPSGTSTISTAKPDPDARSKADAAMRKMYPKSK